MQKKFSQFNIFELVVATNPEKYDVIFLIRIIFRSDSLILMKHL